MEGIDWGSVKSRLDKSSRALKKAMSPDAAHIKSVQRRRAERLARRRVRDDAEKALLPVLSFRLGGECYGIAMTDLTEVLPRTVCTPVPGAPAELLGVVNLHGEIRPVVNAAVVLGVSEMKSENGKCIIFMRRRGGTEVGLGVDHINEVRLVREDELTIPGGETSGLSARYIKGVTPETLILLNTKEILSLPMLKDKQ